MPAPMVLNDGGVGKGCGGDTDERSTGDESGMGDGTGSIGGVGFVNTGLGGGSGIDVGASGPGNCPVGPGWVTSLDPEEEEEEDGVVGVKVKFVVNPWINCPWGVHWGMLRTAYPSVPKSCVQYNSPSLP